jgi:hypothetical protein
VLDNSPAVVHELAITTAYENSYAIFSRVSILTRFEGIASAPVTFPTGVKAVLARVRVQPPTPSKKWGTARTTAGAPGKSPGRFTAARAVRARMGVEGCAWGEGSHARPP